MQGFFLKQCKYFYFTDVKAKEEFDCNILTIPYSVQESSISPDYLFSLEPPSASSEVIEVQDDISTKEETTNDETAEVKVEEAGQLSKTESKHKSIPRRFVSWFSLGISSARV